MNRTKFDEGAAQNSICVRFILRAARVHVSELLNFSRRRLGQRAEHHGAGTFEVGHVVAAPLDDVLGGKLPTV